MYAIRIIGKKRNLFLNSLSLLDADLLLAESIIYVNSCIFISLYERDRGVEPLSSAWKAGVEPIN